MPSSSTRLRRIRDRLDRRVLELVVARHLGADQLQVGLRVASGIGRSRTLAILTTGTSWRAAQSNTIDLDAGSRSARQGDALDLELDPGALELGGRAAMRFAAGDGAGAARRLANRDRLRAAAAASRARVGGPCMRCLEPARARGRGRRARGRPARHRRRGAAQPLRRPRASSTSTPGLTTRSRWRSRSSSSAAPTAPACARSAASR